MTITKNSLIMMIFLLQIRAVSDFFRSLFFYAYLVPFARCWRIDHGLVRQAYQLCKIFQKRE